MKTQTLKIPKLNIKRINEQSTHFQTSRTRLNSEGLGYTFRACKEKIKKSNNVDTSNNRSLISDIAIDSSMSKNPNNVWNISCNEHTDENN